MRFLLIDECSTLGPNLLGLLDAYLRRACCRHTFAKHHRNANPFGGINILLSGDWWQLPPVKSHSIFNNPYNGDYTGEEQMILKMFLYQERWLWIGWDRKGDYIQISRIEFPYLSSFRDSPPGPKHISSSYLNTTIADYRTAENSSAEQNHTKITAWGNGRKLGETSRTSMHMQCATNRSPQM